MTSRNCVWCLHPFCPTRAWQKYCSSCCRRAVERAREDKLRSVLSLRKRQKQAERVCHSCHRPFRVSLPYQPHRLYCSRKCKLRATFDRCSPAFAKIRSHPKVCLRCRHSFKPKHLKHKFCSARCAWYIAKVRRLRAPAFIVTERDLSRLLLRQQGRCYICDAALLGRGEIEHIIPLSRGGRHSIGNIAWACRACNARKLDRFLAEVRYAA